MKFIPLLSCIFRCHWFFVTFGELNFQQSKEAIIGGIAILKTKRLQSFNKIENHFLAKKFQFLPKVMKNHCHQNFTLMHFAGMNIYPAKLLASKINLHDFAW